MIKGFVAGSDKIDLTRSTRTQDSPTTRRSASLARARSRTARASCGRKALGAKMLVSGDVDGNGMADFQILLRGSVALQATDS